MPKQGEPRLTLRFSHEDWEAVERAARVAGVPTGTLVRECAVRWGAVWAANLRAAQVSGEAPKMRRRSGSPVGRGVEPPASPPSTPAAPPLPEPGFWDVLAARTGR